MFEPYFSIPHAVWFTYGQAGDATVEVRLLLQDGGSERHVAKLDHTTAQMLDGLCARFLRYRPDCERRGLDGTYFHAAHYAGDRYLMRTFWSPRDGSIDARFVTVIETLRDYVLLPQGIRALKWPKLHDSAWRLEAALTGER